jgi:ABC-type branched-subunit amino acid transport system ATPase component
MVTGFALSEGHIVLDGVTIERLPAHERQAAGPARARQVGELFRGLTVAGNLLAATTTGSWRTLARDVFGRCRAGAGSDLIEDTLDRIGLADVGDTLARDS